MTVYENLVIEDAGDVVHVWCNTKPCAMAMAKLEAYEGKPCKYMGKRGDISDED